MRVLLTGFEPFGAHRENPSEQVVRALAGRPGVVAAVLPVCYRRAEAQLRALLDAHTPRALLMLGLAAGDAVRLERRARNLDAAEACDEDGEARAGRPISPGGRPTLASTLPLGAFADALGRAAVRWAWSDDAGGFLCNHVFYRACEWLDAGGLAIPRGFVHLPPADALPLARQLEAVSACLGALEAALGGS